MSEEAEERVRKRFGLALSGGGFRAAFFHIGVLARMAEMGILRRVEVISTVSGGSIVGALYYMHVRALLQAKGDLEVQDSDYLEIVSHIEDRFLDAVEKNIRGRTFWNPLKNLKMALPRYSRSDRIGELYDEHLYREAWNQPRFGSGPEEPRTTMIQMRELGVEPVDGPTDFHPLKHNDGRNAPVPILVVNATSLNTGHNWRFEVVGMGEPDRAPVGTPEGEAEESAREDARREIDRNDRFRWTRYALLDDYQARFEVGLAVAASACVPTLFHPLPVTRLFRRDGRKVTVQLVDGGVHDNQGIEGLIEYRCDPIVVSDASGYVPDQDDPTTRIPAVAGRTISIYGDRVREEQLINARLDRDDRRFGLVHLRKGIIGYALAPLGRNGETIDPPRAEPPADFRGEAFGVASHVQDSLSKVRTDLDAFSEVEAFSLILDGYLMAGPNLEHLEVDGAGEPLPPHEWRFLAVAAAAAADEDDAQYRRFRVHLRRARSRFFKPVLLSWLGRITALVLAALLALGIYGLVRVDAVGDFLASVLGRPTELWVVLLVALGVAGLAFLYLSPRLWRPVRWAADRLYTQAVPAVLAIPFWVGALVVLLFSRIFVRIGRVGRVLG